MSTPPGHRTAPHAEPHAAARPGGANANASAKAPGTALPIVLGGLPGVGKITVAREIVARWPAACLRIDAIEQAFLSGAAADRIRSAREGTPR